MIYNYLRNSLIALATAALTMSVAPAQTTLIAGLDSPYKLRLTPEGSLLVAEGGTQVTGARVTLVTPSGGGKKTLLSGLPAAPGEAGTFGGVTDMILRDKTLYVLMGQGDVVTAGTLPGTEVPNSKGASSPLFSSLLSVRFSTPPGELQREFVLTPAHHFTLADGNDVELDNGAGAKATISLVSDFRDVTPDALTVTRASNPFGMEIDPENPSIAYVADSGGNKVVRVDLGTGRSRSIAYFAPVRNPLPFGPPVMDPVPTSVRFYAGQLLVTFLTGFPFAPGAASAMLVNPVTGQQSPFINSRTTAMDIAWRPHGERPQFFVLEFSGNMTANPALPGSLIQYDTEAPKVLFAGLITPVGMALNADTGEIYVTELGTGRIIKFTVQ